VCSQRCGLLSSLYVQCHSAPHLLCITMAVHAMTLAMQSSVLRRLRASLMDKFSLHLTVSGSTAFTHLTHDWQKALGNACNGVGLTLCLPHMIWAACICMLTEHVWLWHTIVQSGLPAVSAPYSHLQSCVACRWWWCLVEKLGGMVACGPSWQPTSLL
jgi:hypothetical protein